MKDNNTQETQNPIYGPEREPIEFSTATRIAALTLSTSAVMCLVLAIRFFTIEHSWCTALAWLAACLAQIGSSFFVLAYNWRARAYKRTIEKLRFLMQDYAVYHQSISLCESYPSEEFKKFIASVHARLEVPIERLIRKTLLGMPCPHPKPAVNDR